MLSTREYADTIISHQSISAFGRRGAFGSHDQVNLISYSDQNERKKLEGNTDQALQYALKELEAKKFCRMTEEIAILFNNTGFIYYLQGQVQEACNFLETSLDILRTMNAESSLEYEKISQNLKLLSKFDLK